MSWVRIPGVKGLVYEPEHQQKKDKKYNCQDCFYCQMCSDIKCKECRKGKRKS